MDNWALQAIERAAMDRARAEFMRTPQTFAYMGVSENRMAWLILDYERRTGQRASELDAGKPYGETK